MTLKGRTLMKLAFLGLVFSVVLSVTGCFPTNSKCERAVENIIAKCGTCLPGSSAAATSSRDSATCKEALMNMCPASSSSAASASANVDGFLNCVANATSCDVILQCS